MYLCVLFTIITVFLSQAVWRNFGLFLESNTQHDTFQYMTYVN